MIIQVKDPSKLLDRAARSLLENGKYGLVRLVLVDQQLKPYRFIGQGDKKILPRFTPCLEKVLRNKRSLFIPEVAKSPICKNCPQRKREAGWPASS